MRPEIQNRNKSNWAQILPLYEAFFHYAEQFGLFPYTLDTKLLELKPTKRGFKLYWYLVNVLYVFTNLTKSIMLFLWNWYTNFEQEDIKGGHFFQLLYCAGPTSIITYIFSQSRLELEYASTLSACIRLEKQIITGK